MSDPFKAGGPALVSFSGGRTSAYMLWRIIKAHGGALPSDVVAVFANTGKEMPQTLDFVRDCSERWAVPIVWVEYMVAERPADRWRIVTYETANRTGEPFAALIDAKNYLPNPVTRFCTIELKIRPMRNLAHSLGWSHWDVVLGLRADEAHRVARAKINREAWDNVMPLASAGITKRDVSEFWEGQNFGLDLLSVKGRTPHGNCDLCFLKPLTSVRAIMRDVPGAADWWIAQESKIGATFRKDRPPYAEIASNVDASADLFAEDGRVTDCFCTGDT